MGTTGNDLCPVNAMLAYLARRGPQSGSLFLFEDGRFLTRDRFVRQIKSALTAAGVSCKHYSGHSFRIAWCCISCEQRHSGGHHQDSRQMRELCLYIKLPREQLAGISVVGLLGSKYEQIKQRIQNWSGHNLLRVNIITILIARSYVLLLYDHVINQ